MKRVGGGLIEMELSEMELRIDKGTFISNWELILVFIDMNVVWFIVNTDVIGRQENYK